MLDVLLIEDNPADVEFTSEVLASWEVDHRLTVARDGEEGLAKLTEGDTPDLVLLDLNLPRLSGVEILRRVRENAELSAVPIIVLATSDAERDVLESQRLAADGYMAKPISVDELQYVYFRTKVRGER